MRRRVHGDDGSLVGNQARRCLSAGVSAVFAMLALFGCWSDNSVAPTPGRFGTFTDPRDDQNRTYKTVKIGNQTWMAENLDYKEDNSWCYDNKEDNCVKYGRLYSWNAARGACPPGWHLPSRQEWGYLEGMAGGNNAGKKLKSKSWWNYKDNGNSGNGTDEYGFSALPGGDRRPSDNTFNAVGYYGYWWTDTENNSGNAYYRVMTYDYDNVGEDNDSESYGFSVRCVKNNE